MDISRIQAELSTAQVDGWLLYDFRGQNPIAVQQAGLKGMHTTRRWFGFIPANGEPCWLISALETHIFDHLPGQKRIYRNWQELHHGLAYLLADAQTILMEYSPQCAVPYGAHVDAGTVELVRAQGVQVQSSENLIQVFQCRWSEAQLASHYRAAKTVYELQADAFRWIGEQIRAGKTITEYDVQQRIMNGFDQAGMVTDHPPIVGVNAHSGNPHYAPSAAYSTEIKANDFVLIDLWAKENAPGSVFADITWVGFVGHTMPEVYQHIWQIVRSGRDAGVALLQQAWQQGDLLPGYQVDDAVRQVIAAAGYGDAFVHRTGHNLGEVTHGNGANIDNFETHETRLLIPGLGFTIEPGIYLPEFGIRSEINLFVDAKTGPVVTTEIQRDIVTCL
ncbi:MAG: aminopeptidase P family protein [Gemmatimonadetes bacterium]|nr:MAG: aminopeptidase P family protein [Gemmatimonadota bacterium]